MRALLVAVFLFLVALPAGAAETVLVSFDAKGTALGWDIGVTEALLERIDPKKVGETIFAGSSSGSLYASFFSCAGLTPASLAELEALASTYASTIVFDEKLTGAKLFLGEDPAQSRLTVERFVDALLRGRTCVPRFPLVIAAGNQDVNDDRTERPFTPRGGKAFRLADHAILAGDGRPLGKSCTYFTDATMFEALSRVPVEERLCDLRRIETAEDLRLAVLATVSEPTYFAPVAEPEPTKLVAFVADPKKRVYNGGYAVPTIAQDVKRVFPKAVSLSTGRYPFTRFRDRAVRTWFLVPMNEVALQQSWWLDFRVAITKDEWDRLNLPHAPLAAQSKLGRDAMTKCLAEQCRPPLFLEPKYDYAAGRPAEKLAALTKRGIRVLLKQ